jgi:hypothetical protein
VAEGVFCTAEDNWPRYKNFFIDLGLFADNIEQLIWVALAWKNGGLFGFF